jgi:hypothetical protein
MGRWLENSIPTLRLFWPQRRSSPPVPILSSISVGDTCWVLPCRPCGLPYRLRVFCGQAPKSERYYQGQSR